MCTSLTVGMKTALCLKDMHTSNNTFFIAEVNFQSS